MISVLKIVESLTSLWIPQLFREDLTYWKKKGKESVISLYEINWFPLSGPKAIPFLHLINFSSQDLEISLLICNIFSWAIFSESHQPIFLIPSLRAT
jgi:hypothetical protein